MSGRTRSLSAAALGAALAMATLPSVLAYAEPPSAGGFYRGVDGEPYEVLTSGGQLSRRMLPLFGPTDYLYSAGPSLKDDFWHYTRELANPSASLGSWPWDGRASISAFAYSKDGTSLVIGSDKGEIVSLSTRGKNSVFSAFLDGQRISRLAYAGSQIVASAGGRCFLIDPGKPSAMVLGEAAQAVSIFVSEQADRLGIISYWEDPNESGVYTSVYDLPSGKILCHLNEESGRRGIFSGPDRIVIERLLGGNGEKGQSEIRYAAFDARTGDILPVTGEDAGLFAPWMPANGEKPPKDIGSWQGPGALSFDGRGKEFRTIESGPYYLASRPPHLTSTAKGLGIGEGATLTFDGRQIWLYEALAWKGKTIILFQPSVDYDGGKVDEQGWRYVIAIFDERCRPIALFHNGAGSELPSMAVAGDKLDLMNNYSLVEIDLNTMKTSVHGFEPQLPSSHLMTGMEDGGLAILGLDGDGRPPASLSVISPSRDGMASWKFEVSPGFDDYAQASLLPIDESSFLLTYTGEEYRSEPGPTLCRAFAAVSSQGQVLAQAAYCGDRDEGGHGTWLVPVSAQKAGLSTKASYWDGQSFLQLRWTGPLLAFTSKGDGRRREEPPKDIPGQAYQYGGACEGGIFIARTGSSYSPVLNPEEGEFDSVWLDAAPGNSPSRGFGITEALGRWHPFGIRGFVPQGEASVVLAGSLQGESNRHQEAVLYRVARDDLGALGKAIDLTKSPAKSWSVAGLADPPYALRPQSISLKPMDGWEPWIAGDPSLMGMEARTPALSGDPQRGILNDSGVRMRQSPGLEGQAMGKLERGTAVHLLGRSASRQKIDGMTAYWLKVSLEDGREGWVYGWFVDCPDPSGLPAVKP